MSYDGRKLLILPHALKRLEDLHVAFASSEFGYVHVPKIYLNAINAKTSGAAKKTTMEMVIHAAIANRTILPQKFAMKMAMTAMTAISNQSIYLILLLSR